MSVLRIMLALVCAGGLIACGSGTNASVPPSTVEGAPPAEPAPAKNAIDIYEADNAFFREAKQVVVLKVNSGETVRFKNKDGLPHSLYSESESNQFDLGQLHQFESRNVTFDRRGDVEVRCQVHPDMLLMVEVQ